MADKPALLPILNGSPSAEFNAALRQHGMQQLQRRELATLQINVGK